MVFMNCKIGKMFGIAAFLLVFSSCIHAFNFGSLMKIGYSEVYDGRAVFEILLWTSDSEDVEARLFVESAPDKWKVEILSPNLTISRETGNEMVVSGKEYVRASAVRIFAYPPAGEKPGEYQIRLRASAYRGSSEMQSNQERVFSLVASLKGEHMEGENLPDISAFIIAVAIIILIALAALRFLQ